MIGANAFNTFLHGFTQLKCLFDCPREWHSDAGFLFEKSTRVGVLSFLAISSSLVHQPSRLSRNLHFCCWDVSNASINIHIVFNYPPFGNIIPTCTGGIVQMLY